MFFFVLYNIINSIVLKHRHREGKIMGIGEGSNHKGGGGCCGCLGLIYILIDKVINDTFN